MSTVEMQSWIGRQEQQRDTIDTVRAQRMHALFDYDPARLGAGAELPLGYHWLYCVGINPRSEWGQDGHARRGGFLPPMASSRRMWAGGSLRFLQALHIGEAIERRSSIAAIEQKEGRSGHFHLVRVDHQIHGPNGLAIEEQQNLVYLPLGAPSGNTTPSFPKAEPEWRKDFRSDEVVLFYFSALTMNGHRIHYDYRYATEQEGYRGLLVHAPLTALLLLDATRQHRPQLRSFKYRAISPLFCGDTITLASAGQNAWALRADGSIAMEATIDG